MYNNHLSLTEIAIHFNLQGTNIVGKWERIYYDNGPQDLYIKRRGRIDWRIKNMIFFKETLFTRILNKTKGILGIKKDTRDIPEKKYAN